MKTQWLRISALVLMTLGALFLFGTGTVDAATKTWDGGGGDGLWVTPTNWNDNIVPTNADDVVLDNSNIAGSYTVTLPGGAANVTINKLTIAPDSGNTITLILPSGNTNNPGFTVGDGTVSTDDIVINSGGILRNSSGASAGNGIAFNSPGNDTLRINNGGQYIHNTVRGNSGIVSQLSSVPGTESGMFEFDVPGTASYTISASGRTYGNLALTRSAGSATYTASGAGALTIRGNFTINSGVTFNSTMSGNLNLAGNWINNGTYSTTSQTVIFNGSSIQNLTANSAITFNNLTVNSGVTLVETVSANNATVSGILTNNGTIRKDQAVSGTGAKTFGLAGAFNGANLSIDVTTQGGLSNLRVERIDSNHPNAAPPQQTGRYWSITPTDGGYTANLILPRSNGGNPTACKYTGTGTVWACQANSQTPNTVTQNGITAFSDWAVGNNAPTAAILTAFSAKAKSSTRVKVKWESGSNMGITGFNVQRATKRNGIYKTLKSVTTDPTEPIGHNYKFTDKTVKSGKAYFYRIEILKADTTTELSDVIKVQVP